MICQNCFKQVDSHRKDSIRVQGGCICGECIAEFKKCPKCWMLIHHTNPQRYCWDCVKEVKSVKKQP